MGTISRWWHTPSHYQWLSDYIRSRGMQRQTRITTGVVTACLGLMPVVMLLSPSGAQGTVGRSIAVAVSLLCVMMACLWMIRWPTPTQSLVYVLVTNVCCSAGCLIVVNPLAGLSAASCFSILAGYVAFFHSARVYVVTLAFTAVTAATLGVELATTTHDLILAVLKVVLVILSVAAVPFVNQILMANVSGDVVNSDLDPLTGLSNRRGFSRHATELINASNKSPRRKSGRVSLAVLMIDLDDFKRVNDTYGHASGDRALIAVGGVLRRNCNPALAVFARVGGEEFLVAERCGEDAEMTAENIRREIAEAPFDVTASVGVATGSLDSTCDRVELLDHFIVTADAAMYAAKRAGGNRVVCQRIVAPVKPTTETEGLPDGSFDDSRA